MAQQFKSYNQLDKHQMVPRITVEAVEIVLEIECTNTWSGQVLQFMFHSVEKIVPCIGNPLSLFHKKF